MAGLNLSRMHNAVEKEPPGLSLYLPGQGGA